MSGAGPHRTEGLGAGIRCGTTLGVDDSDLPFCDRSAIEVAVAVEELLDRCIGRLAGRQEGEPLCAVGGVCLELRDQSAHVGLCIWNGRPDREIVCRDRSAAITLAI